MFLHNETERCLGFSDRQIEIHLMLLTIICIKRYLHDNYIFYLIIALIIIYAPDIWTGRLYNHFTLFLFLMFRRVSKLSISQTLKLIQQPDNHRPISDISFFFNIVNLLNRIDQRRQKNIFQNRAYFYKNSITCIVVM